MGWGTCQLGMVVCTHVPRPHRFKPTQRSRFFPFARRLPPKAHSKMFCMFLCFPPLSRPPSLPRAGRGVRRGSTAEGTGRQRWVCEHTPPLPARAICCVLPCRIPATRHTTPATRHPPHATRASASTRTHPSPLPRQLVDPAALARNLLTCASQSVRSCRFVPSPPKFLKITRTRARADASTFYHMHKREHTRMHMHAHAQHAHAHAHAHACRLLYAKAYKCTDGKVKGRAKLKERQRQRDIQRQRFRNKDRDRDRDRDRDKDRWPAYLWVFGCVGVLVCECLCVYVCTCFCVCLYAFLFLSLAILYY